MLRAQPDEMDSASLSLPSRGIGNMTVRNGVGFRTLLEEANAVVEAIDPSELSSRLEDEDLVVIDLRDIRELEREGRLPGAVHTPRGPQRTW